MKLVVVLNFFLLEEFKFRRSFFLHLQHLICKFEMTCHMDGIWNCVKDTMEITTGLTLWHNLSGSLS